MEQQQADKHFKDLFFSTEQTKSKNKLFSLAFFWLGISVSLIFLITFGILYLKDIPSVEAIINRLFSSFTSTILLTLVNFALLLGIFFVLRKPESSLVLCISLYLVFTVFEGFYLGTLFLIYNVQIREILPLFLVPTIVFIIMGLLGYYNIFDFSKILPFLVISIFGLMIFSLLIFLLPILSFIPFLYKIYSLIAFIVFSLWIGFDIQMIQRTSRVMEYGDKKTLWKISIMMGLKLFVDFFNLLILALRLFKN